MIIGYARVSTQLQKIDLQLKALEQTGCQRIYKDEGQSGVVFERSGLKEALETLEAGSTLVVWRLDRLGRSLTQLVSLIDLLGKRQVHFRSIMENIDTTSSGGRLMFHMMAALAEFERTLISERTRAGLDAAKARGKRIGRPCALTTKQIDDARAVHSSGEKRMREIAEMLRVSPRTLRRRMKIGPHARDEMHP